MLQELEEPSDTRVFTLACALLQGYSVDQLHDLTKIDKWFLFKLENIIRYAENLRKYFSSVS